VNDISIALADVCSGHPALVPPSRMRVSEGAAQILMIKRPGGGSGPWSPTETTYMVEPMDTLASRRHSAVCFVGPAQTGKCLDVATPIATPAGWATMGALQAGDVVYGPDGEETRVLFASEVKHGRPCYELEFSDGSTLVADDEHRWAVERFFWKSPQWRSMVLTTQEMVDGGVTYSEANGRRPRYRFRVRVAAPIAAPRAEVPLDPYLLGVWLGDGVSRAPYVSAHRDDAGFYVEQAAAAGFFATVAADKGNTVVVRLSRAFGDGLRELRLPRDKHIPPAYLRASVEQRWALLQGLMDTDGTIAEGGVSCEFSTARAEMVEGFVELAASLGLKPSVKFKATTWRHQGERRHGAAWRVTFPAPAGRQPFRLPRKVARVRPAEREVCTRSVVAIRPVESRPVKCIQVDNASHLFLAGKRFVPTHNTVALVDGWMAHAVVNDPGDMAIFQMTQDKAREFSKQRLDRAIRNSPRLHAMRSAMARDDNLHDKQFKNGMWVRIAWPTATNMASTSYRYVAGTDYDRWPDDIDGEGDGFTLMGKRITTFLSRGMVAVESSPGRPITDPTWAPSTPHEGPPVGGIGGIYNRGDRRRWYWKCPHCASWFEARPGLGLFGLPSDDELLETVRDMDIDAFARQYARALCPTSGCVIRPADREGMNRRGRWLQDGLVLDERDRLSGTPRTSSIASYWLGGAAATYVTWEQLIRKHLQALAEYAMTGSELQLMTTANTDQGVPYMSRLLAAARDANRKAVYDASLKRYIVPPWARFLVASVDVQGGRNARFVVQVHAVAEGQEQALVDRYNITASKRPGVGDEFAPIDPAAYPEDWDVLTEKVVNATYRLEDGKRELKLRLSVVDTGGEDGVTNNAYAWYRRLRKAGLHDRVRLIKGSSTKVDWHMRESMVGGKQGEGDVPLWLLDPNKFKDLVANGLARSSPGPGYYHWPQPRGPKNPDGWLAEAFFDELKAEVRQADGRWSQVKPRNEAFDLSYMIRAGCMMLKADKRDFWGAPPDWALPLDQGNTDVMTREERREMKEAAAPTYRRKTHVSPYLD
jgi:phage terminase large subunit GpA-like protein